MPDPTLGIALQWQYEREQLAARVRGLEAELARVRAATLEECAKIVDDFQRQLPIFDDPELDSVSDDAVTVMLHAAAAIRALGAVSDG